MDLPMYDLTDLGLLPTDPTGPAKLTRSDATALNDLPERFQVAGYCTSSTGVLGDVSTGDPLGAFIWEEVQGQAANLIPLGGDPLYPFAQALGLNNVFPSVVVGWSSHDGFTPTWTIWQRDGTSYGPTGQARSVNDDGYVVGWMTVNTTSGVPVRHACVGTPSGEQVDLFPGDHDGQWTSDAYQINNQGLVVGWTTFPLGIKQACAWDLGGQYQNLSNPPIYRPLETNAQVGTASAAYGVNNAGAIVATLTTWDGTSVSGWQTDISGNRVYPDPGSADPNKYGFTYYDPLIPLGINDQNVIVGTCGTEYEPAGVAGRRHAFVCVAGPGDVAADLNSWLTATGAGWELLRANAINNRGQIVGDAVLDGQLHGWLLTPVAS